MTFLGGIAVALQVLGLIVTAIGLRITWREFHEPGERFVDPFVRALKRLDPRGRRDRQVRAGVGEAIATIDDANGQVTFGPLPDDDRAAIERLAERLQDLRANLESTTADIRRDLGQISRRVTGLEGHVEAEVGRLDRADGHVATDGLRLECIGLLILALGVVAQAIDMLT
jgi:hypothetical protein